EDGDDHEYDFKCIRCDARPTRAVMDRWFGRYLEPVVDGLPQLAPRAGSDCPALGDERPRAQGYRAQPFQDCKRREGRDRAWPAGRPLLSNARSRSTELPVPTR